MIQSTEEANSVTNDTDLVTKAQQGDRNAFGELVQKYFPCVVEVVYRMCGDPQLAEDAAQEAFIRAWLNLSSFRPLSSLRNWLFRIAVNAALDNLRKKQAGLLEDVETKVTIDQELDPESSVIRTEQAAMIQKAIHTLPETTRSVLVLREYGECSYKEIAAVLDIPIGTVMSRLNYARQRLRELLQVSLSNAEKEDV